MNDQGKLSRSIARQPGAGRIGRGLAVRWTKWRHGTTRLLVREKSGEKEKKRKEKKKSWISIAFFFAVFLFPEIEGAFGSSWSHPRMQARRAHEMVPYFQVPGRAA